eukprot:2371854-Pyramimonas_sp.AAC.1
MRGRSTVSCGTERASERHRRGALRVTESDFGHSRGRRLTRVGARARGEREETRAPESEGSPFGLGSPNVRNMVDFSRSSGLLARLPFERFEPPTPPAPVGSESEFFVFEAEVDQKLVTVATVCAS